MRLDVKRIFKERIPKGVSITPTEKAAVEWIAISKTTPDNLPSEDYLIRCLYSFIRQDWDYSGDPMIDAFLGEITDSVQAQEEYRLHREVARTRNNYSKTEILKKIEYHYKQLENQMEDRKVMHAKEDYFKSHPGFEEYAMQLRSDYSEICFAMKEKTVEKINETVISTIGPKFRVYDVLPATASLNIYMLKPEYVEAYKAVSLRELPPYQHCEFGMDIELRFRPYQLDYSPDLNGFDDSTDENLRNTPECNIGSMGSFKVQAGTGSASLRAEYYIALGKLLDDTVAMSSIEKESVDFANEVYRKKALIKLCANFIDDPIKYESQFFETFGIAHNAFDEFDKEQESKNN